MESSKLHFAMFVLCLATSSTMVAADDFDTARQKINQAKANIDYSSFCTERKAGEDKIACRIKDVSSVGFLVCKTPQLEGVNCDEVIRTEVNNIETIIKGNVKTVKISPPPIDGVRCGNHSSTSCSGFLEKWIATDKGRFEHVRDHIANKTVPRLITKVKSYTSPGRLPNTAADLKNIKNYMTLDPVAKAYRQICDLQGFFLVNGGFLVADVPMIKNTTANEGCWSDEPTAQQVLDALNEMITAFSSSVQSTDPLTSGGPNRVSPFISTLTLINGLQLLRFIVKVGII